MKVTTPFWHQKIKTVDALCLENTRLAHRFVPAVNRQPVWLAVCPRGLQNRSYGTNFVGISRYTHSKKLVQKVHFAII